MNNVFEGKKYENFEVNYDVKIKCKKCGKSYTKCICCFEKEKITKRKIKNAGCLKCKYFHLGETQYARDECSAPLHIFNLWGMLTPDMRNIRNRCSDFVAGKNNTSIY